MWYKLTRPLSLAGQMTLLTSIVTIVIFLIAGWLIIYTMERHFVAHDAARLEMAAKSLERLCKASLSKDSHETTRSKINLLISDFYGVFTYIADGQGKEIYASPGPDIGQLVGKIKPSRGFDDHAVIDWQDQRVSASTGEDAHITTIPAKNYRVSVIQLTANDEHSDDYTLVVAVAMDAHRSYLEGLTYSILLTTIIASLILVLMARLIFYQGHAPIRQISEQIRNISSSQLHVRLDPAQVPIELSVLVQSFNQMLERIESVFKQQSHFSADIAHELRTPITSLTTQAQIVLSQSRSKEEYQDALYSALEDYNRMAKMITDMLFLAEADNNTLVTHREAIHLTEEVDALFEYLEAWAEERQISLRCVGQVPPVYADKLMIRRALSNLLCNAMRYTDQGQSVIVNMNMVDQHIMLSVSNYGTIIDKQHIPHIFDRFYRADQSRQNKGTGAGIGLAIVKSIIDAHGGSIHVTSENGMTCFTIMLPITERH